MEYITTKEASEKWAISTTRITILANEGRIPGAKKHGKSWLIPSTATKPEKHKPHHKTRTTQETNNFLFPLYPFQPYWSHEKESLLSDQQKNLLLAENAIFECRFSDAYSLIESILISPDDVVTEIGCLWCAGICYIALNKSREFSKAFLRLQLLLSEDFPHHNDLVIILDTLKTYVETIGSSANNSVINTDIHEQCLPLACTHMGYISLTKEALHPGTVDANSLEINLRFLKNTDSTIAVELMHIYLLGIYYLRNNLDEMVRHAKLVVQIAYENNLYFPLVTYYHYFAPILSPIIEQYSEEFQGHCHKLITQFEKNFTTFLSSKDESVIVSQISEKDYPLIFAILSGLPNPLIAEKLRIHPQTVKRKIAKICKIVGVASKKELKEFLQNNI